MKVRNSATSSALAKEYSSIVCWLPWSYSSFTSMEWMGSAAKSAFTPTFTCRVWKKGSLRSTSVAWSAHSTGWPSASASVVMLGRVPWGTMFHSTAEFSRYCCSKEETRLVSNERLRCSMSSGTPRSSVGTASMSGIILRSTASCSARSSIARMRSFSLRSASGSGRTASRRSSMPMVSWSMNSSRIFSTYSSSPYICQSMSTVCS